MKFVDLTPVEIDAFLDSQCTAQLKHYQKAFPEAKHDLLLLDGEPIGRIYVERNAAELNLLDICLLPEYRNRGIGTNLMRELIEETELSGLPFHLCVYMYNAGAFRLYRRMGFEVIKESPPYIFLERLPCSSNSSID